MTVTDTRTAPELKLDTKYRVIDNKKASGGASGYFNVGDIVTLYSTFIDGDGEVKVALGNTFYYLLPSGLELIEEAFVFAVGDRVKVLFDGDGPNGERGRNLYYDDFVPGDVAVIESISDTSYNVRFEKDGTTKYVDKTAQVEKVSSESVTTESSASAGELASAVARAEAAEKALADYKIRVRDAVIAEAEQQEWCDRVDGWLSELGLERESIGELEDVDRYAVVLLTNGNTAIKQDEDSEPWRVYSREGVVVGGWRTDVQIARLLSKVIFTGE